MERKLVIWSLCVVAMVSLQMTISTPVHMNREDGMKFLKHYGYLPQTDLETGALRSPDEIKKAIMHMQRIANIPMTGELDNATLTMMAKPRCGMYDVAIHTSDRVKRYITTSGWTKLDLTWRLVRGSLDLPDEEVKATLRQAMKMWSDQSQLTFRELTSGDVDMKILFGYGYHGDSYRFDTEGGVLAHAFYPRSPYWGGDLHFDEAEKWTVRSETGQNLLYVAVHELGHALGLRHSDVFDSIMYPYARGYDPNLKLYQDDIQGIQSLYGKPKSGETTPAVTTPSTTTTTVAPTEPPTRPGYCPMKIDALSVIRGETFIFSGTNYWRYNYAGMVGTKPRPISELWNMPGSGNIDAAYMRPYSGGYTIVFFSGKNVYEFDGTVLRARKTLQDLGLPEDVDHLDAAFVWGQNDMTYLVSGQMYWRYDDKTRRVMADYPRDMAMWGGVPVPVDSAYSTKDRDGVQRTYFFKGMDYYEVEDNVMRVRANQRPPTVQFWAECFSSIREEISAAGALSPLSVTLILAVACNVFLFLL